MKNIRKKQIKKLFNNFINTIYKGIWFFGIIKVGKYKEWYSNGQIYIKANYNENGKKIGKYKKWHSNGQICIEANYNEKGKRIGEYKEWYNNRYLKIEANYNGNGKKIGKYKEWFNNGQLREIVNYNKKGELNGLYKFYSIDKELIFEIEFKDNKLIGINYVNLEFSRDWFEYYNQIQDKYINFYNKIKKMYNDEKYKKKTN